MLAWPVDNAFYLYILLLCVAAGFLIAWWQTRERRWAKALGITAGLAGLLFLLTLVVNTDRKEIERTLRTMARHMDANHVDQVFEHVSDRFSSNLMVGGATSTFDKKQLYAAARRAVRNHEVDGVSIKHVSVEMVTDSEALVSFSAAPVLEENTLLFPCEARFVKEADDRWRMTALQVFHPWHSKELYDIPR